MIKKLMMVMKRISLVQLLDLLLLRLSLHKILHIIIIVGINNGIKDKVIREILI